MMTTDEHERADRLVSIVVVVFVIKAVGVIVLLASATFRETSGTGLTNSTCAFCRFPKSRSA